MAHRRKNRHAPSCELAGRARDGCAQDTVEIGKGVDSKRREIQRNRPREGALPLAVPDRADAVSGLFGGDLGFALLVARGSALARLRISAISSGEMPSANMARSKMRSKSSIAFGSCDGCEDHAHNKAIIPPGDGLSLYAVARSRDRFGAFLAVAFGGSGAGLFAGATPHPALPL
jgi:hypothetical protein